MFVGNLGKELKAGLEAKYKQTPSENKTAGKSTLKAKSASAMIQDERLTKLTKLAAKIRWVLLLKVVKL